MLLNHTTSFVNFAHRKTYVLGKLNGRLKLELALAILPLNMHMHMHSWLFPREEVETETAFAKNSCTHGSIGNSNVQL